MSVMKKWIGSGFVCVLLFAPALVAAEKTAKKPAASKAAPQRTYATAKEAADALIAAATVNDVPALKAILGPDGGDLVATSGPGSGQEPDRSVLGEGPRKDHRRPRREEQESRDPRGRGRRLADADPDRP